MISQITSTSRDFVENSGHSSAVACDARHYMPSVSVPEEHKYHTVTVVFCDLVDSTRLSVQLKPLELREVFLAYYSKCSDVIERHSGLVLGYVGDGILALFAHGSTRELDARAAVHSGLEMIEAVQELDATLGRRKRIALSARLSAATGTVVGAGLCATEPAATRLVFGQVTYLAARLNDVARPNTMVVSASTHRLLAHRFRFEHIGYRAFKGFSDPVNVWSITQSSGSYVSAQPSDCPRSACLMET